MAVYTREIGMQGEFMMRMLTGTVTTSEFFSGNFPCIKKKTGKSVYDYTGASPESFSPLEYWWWFGRVARKGVSLMAMNTVSWHFLQ
jgi:hypothetical protein